MDFHFFDTETHLIKPGLAAPQLVCVSKLHDQKTALHDRFGGRTHMRDVLEDSKTIIVGHNVFYDLGVLCAEDPGVFVPLVFKAFDEFRVRDTIVRQQLIDIATGNLKYRYDEEKSEYVKTGYTLADLVLRLLDRVLPKADTWRLKYALLTDVPLDEWPEDARKYAVDDAVAASEVFWKQAQLTGASVESPGGVIPTEERATRDAWALWLMSAWGIRTDGAAVERLRESLEAEQVEAALKLHGTGIIKPKAGGWSRDMKEIYRRVEAGFKAQGRTVPTTASGRVGTDHDAMIECGDPDIRVLADAAKGAKLLSTYIPMLEGGTQRPICARFNVLVESNRTSCSGPNLQNPPRSGGARECFVPRPGYVFCSVDYDTIELRSLAQTCLDILGFSQMAAALREGRDLHLDLAADFLGLSREGAAQAYVAGDKKVSDGRQLSKIMNFGAPGGMSSDSFVDYAKGYGVVLERQVAKALHNAWHEAWPEMRPYFDHVSSLVGGHGEAVVSSPRSGFVRGGLGYCQLANHYFQSLTATGAKNALWDVTRECYRDTTSPLWGCRPVIFMHDEIITELPEHKMHEAATRQAELMIATMQKWIPDIPIKASPTLFRRWYKGAKPVKIDGRLVPSKPVEIDGKTKWVADV